MVVQVCIGYSLPSAAKTVKSNSFTYEKGGFTAQ
jgi:hypothetical protein